MDDIVKQAIRQGTPAQLISVDTLVRTVVVAGKPVERKALYGNISFAKGETSWEVFKIDLDAMVRHDSHTAFVRDWRRDRARFLRNWPTHSALYRWLDANLPEAA